MATRLKTVHYAFPTLASLANNTLTNLTQRTIRLSETGTKTFRSVVAHVTFDDIITATGGSLTTKTLNLRLGAAGYTSVANGNTLTNSGENHSFHLVADYTSHFTTNWSGTSMTCDFQLQINQSSGTTLGMVNVCVTLEISYEYDDTSTLQVKTVMIPLNAPVGALTTGATTYDTFPALDTYLPEASKTYRGMYVVVQGNEHRNAGTTDHTMTISVGATRAWTSTSSGRVPSIAQRTTDPAAGRALAARGHFVQPFRCPAPDTYPPDLRSQRGRRLPCRLGPGASVWLSFHSADGLLPFRIHSPMCSWAAAVCAVR
jgi:hypothetical protein